MDFRIFKVFEIRKIQRKSQKIQMNSQNYIQYAQIKCTDNINLSEVKIINIFVLMLQAHLVVKTVQWY
jgi:hypothetical protein